MSTTYKRLLSDLAQLRVRPGWFTKIIKNLGVTLRDMLLYKSEVILGGFFTKGTITASTIPVTMTALDAKLNGDLKLQLAAIAVADDLLDPVAPMGQPIYEDGADATAVALGTDEEAHVTVIAVNSDGAGAATGEEGAMLLVPVVAGDAATFAAATQPLTDDEIEAALAASTGVHDGTTGWVRLADIVWTDTGGAAWDVVITANRDA